MINPNSFYIETYGCSFNQSDSKKIENILRSGQFNPDSFDHAEYIIINTCAVKSQTHEKNLYRIKNISLDANQKIIIMGCLPWISDETLEKIKNLNDKIIAIVDVNSYDRILDIIREYDIKKQQIIQKSNTKINKGNLKPWIDDINTPGIVQISEGCNGNCSFCCTKIARGTLNCYSLESIINQIKYYIDHNLREIYLTAQDCGIYKYENFDLSKLLEEINLNFLDNTWISLRLGMLDPKYLIKNLEKLLKQIASPIFYKFLHIPIQSASDEVLKKMRRRYNNNQINEIFSKLKENYDISISTDIICGFPGESEEDFMKTMQFIKRYTPDIINISKFTPRPNTDAKKMKQLDSQIVKERSMKLTHLYNEYIEEKNKKFMGTIEKVLITKFNPNKNYPFSGRNKYYKPIVLKNGEINNFYNIKIVETRSNFLIGRIIE